MAADVTREEFEARVGVLEREVEGEKMVTRHILEQTRHNADDLAGIKTRLDRVERKVDGVERKVDGLERKVDGVERKVDGLAKDVDGLKKTMSNLVRDLPKIIGAAVRDVLPKRDAKAPK
jgi:uncharacterized protein YoxC